MNPEVAELKTRFGTSLDLEDVTRDLAEEALKRSGDNRTQAAMIMGISVRTLQRLIKRFGWPAGPFKGRPRPYRPLCRPVPVPAVVVKVDVPGVSLVRPGLEQV